MGSGLWARIRDRLPERWTPVECDADGNLHTAGRLYRFNGTTWDPWYNNHEETLLEGAVRTATVRSALMTNYDHHHHLLFLHVEAVTDTPSITLSVQTRDPVSLSYFTIWSAAVAVAAPGDYLYCLAPAGGAALYTENVNVHFGRRWRAVVTHADADPIEYSLACVCGE